MNEESSVSVSVVVAGVVWVSTGILLLIAWVAWAVGDRGAHLAILIAETACALSAVAAVLQVRVYSARVCAQIRAVRADVRSQEPTGGRVRGV